LETSTDSTFSPKSEILYGSENAVERGTAFMKNTKMKMDITFDHKAPSIVVNISDYYNGYKDILARGGKIRCITEITPENIDYCKKLLGLVSELRHLDGLKGGIAINETEYMATTVLHNSRPLTEVIYSNVDEVVAQGQYIFDTLWKNSIPANRRIKEIEEGMEPIKTEVLETTEEIAKKLHQITSESNYLHICSTTGGMALGHENYLEIDEKTNKKFSDGSVKWVTSITNMKDVNIVTLFLKQGIKVKHISDIPSINFVISDKYFASTTEKVSGRETISNFLVSNDPAYIEHFSTIFDNTWKLSEDIDKRVRELQEEDLFKAKIISNPNESLDLLNVMYASANNEILILLPSLNSLLRIRNSKDLEKLNELGLKGIIIKILIIPSHRIDKLKEIQSRYPKIEFRALQFNFPILNRITIIDTFKTIIIKIKDDSKTSTTNALGITTFIEGEHTALSYKSIFNTLWEQPLAFEKLKKTNKKLQSHGKLQKEFMDILAHEIRSPIQPIIGLTEYVKNNLKDKQQIELLDSVIANGQKLNTLTENMLDISRMEDNLFSIRKKNFDLNESISNTVKIFEEILRNSKNKIKFEFTDCRNDYFITGDKMRIEQVVSNLIHNSIKSISRLGKNNEEGRISIIIKNKNKKEIPHKLSRIVQMVEIVIDDNGKGIDSKIMPKLFSKFTQSLDGNGLGLYISKKIVESHGGKISAENRKRIGARFTVTLPLNSIRNTT
jgi:signal transduction histidine kinase